MKSTKTIAPAIWLLEHLGFGANNEALSGDLLEQFHRGRSAAWLWCEALTAIAVHALSTARLYALPLTFSCAWGMLYRAWNLSGRDWAQQAALLRWPQLAWPGSAFMDLCLGVAPAITFVWLGFLVYLLFRAADAIPVLSLLRGLSQSLTALLIATMLLLHRLRHPQIDLHSVTRADFYSTCQAGGISVAIALSLFAALLVTVGSTPRIVRRRRNSPLSVAGRVLRFGRAAGLSSFVAASAAGQAPPPNPAPYTVQMVPVDKDVRLEVLDWGGAGRPLVFLAGLGNDAHVFERLAPKFTGQNHVYGITRRGFGASSQPAPTADNYTADRLGDDVLAVIDALKLEKPVLAGHSLAGEELSSIGSRHPERISGLIYLDAAYGYAYYDRAHGDEIFDFFTIEKLFDEFVSGAVQDRRQFAQALAANVSTFNRDLSEAAKRDPSLPGLHPPRGPIPPIVAAINLGGEKYEKIDVPILAIFACPHNFDFDRSLRGDPAAKAAIVAEDTFATARQADAFAAGVPTARVVRIADADHFVFNSNEAEVVREMNTFLASLR
jgi:pimeloyl-ACP methyl ester carboxylesterase